MLHSDYTLDNLRKPNTTGVATLIIGYLLYRVIKYFLWGWYTSPLRQLRCAPGGRGILGHWPDMMSYSNGPAIDTWHTTLGPTFTLHGPFYTHHRLYTSDHRAISHIMAHHEAYQKPLMLRRMMGRYMREGLLIAEGHRWKVQRKVVQKLFGRGSLRGMERIVGEKAEQLREIWTELLVNPTSSHPISPAPTPNSLPSTSQPEGDTQTVHPDESRIIDVYGTAACTTYDIIGKIAIDHDFDSLGHPHSEGGVLFEAYEEMQRLHPGSGKVWSSLTALWPVLNKIWPSEDCKRIAAAMDPLNALAEAKIEERKREVKEKKRSDGKDLLSLMRSIIPVRANLAPDVSPEWVMREEEIAGQLTTFMFAGSDTSTGTIAWALYHIARNPHFQTALRSECLGYGEALPFEQMDELPILDVVLMETLRTNPSIPSTVREAMADDVIPLSTPIIDRYGKSIDSVRIRKGQMIHIPIENLNMSPAHWGPSARHFDPSRWLSPSFLTDPLATHSYKSPSTQDGPGVWPNLMTFIDGPRRCVGYKLAIMECKMLLFCLIRNFVFEEVEGKRIYKWNLLSTRPYVGGDTNNLGSSLPLLVRAYKG